MIQTGKTPVLDHGDPGTGIPAKCVMILIVDGSSGQVAGILFGNLQVLVNRDP